jgi:hypothetical protein
MTKVSGIWRANCEYGALHSSLFCNLCNGGICVLNLHRDMVLADLGRKLNSALSQLNRAPVIDEKVY